MAVGADKTVAERPFAQKVIEKEPWAPAPLVSPRTGSDPMRPLGANGAHRIAARWTAGHAAGHLLKMR